MWIQFHQRTSSTNCHFLGVYVSALINNNDLAKPEAKVTTSFCTNVNPFGHMPLTRLVRVCACIHLWLSALWGRVAEWFSMQRCMGNEPVPHTHQKGQKTQNAQNETSGTTTKQQNNKIACMLLFLRAHFVFCAFFVANIEAYTSSSECGCFCWPLHTVNPFGVAFCCLLFEFPSGMKYIAGFLFCVCRKVMQ